VCANYDEYKKGDEIWLMILKICNLKNNISGIYKVNFPNGKIYIGQSCNIKRRMYEHNNTNKLITPCDYAVLKYGKISEIEILEIIDDLQLLNEREKYWIKYYSSTDRKIGYNLCIGGKTLQGENSPRAKFSNEDVYTIRLKKFQGELKKEVYNEFYSDYKFGTFENIWLGRTYSNIGTELKIKYDAKLYSGEKSKHSKLTEDEVLKIRKRYDNGEMQKDIAEDYPFVGRNAIRSVCKRLTWKTI